MKVSFIVIAYNEQDTLKILFHDIVNQDYNHDLIEVILVDGMSTDNTKKVMNEFSQEDNGFMRVVVKDNPKKTLPCGWNIALSESKGEIIIRVDAHSSIPTDFISKNVKCIKGGERICGGYRPNIIDEETPWKKTLLLAETSMFGSSIAPYRRNSERRYVKSVFHGAYSKEVFEKVGFYNELLTRTEDNEMHYRMRKAGYNICFDPNIISYQHTRNSFKKMLKQKYLNGYWIGATLSECTKCFSFYHFVPFLFFMAVIFTTLLSLLGNSSLSLLLWSIYFAVNIIISSITILKNKFSYTNLVLPFLFVMLHLCYGYGTLVGILKTFGVVYKRKHKLKKQKGEYYVESH
ncbi:MAG: glycosyltransferase family 2 protein [Clostridium sp.]|nr:glycosyltransferase family 2 protein [Clostridium sp.]MDU7084330.1 glycosyltransferase family 2 protein [Clostridium sp.]